MWCEIRVVSDYGGLLGGQSKLGRLLAWVPEDKHSKHQAMMPFHLPFDYYI